MPPRRKSIFFSSELVEAGLVDLEMSFEEVRVARIIIKNIKQTRTTRTISLDLLVFWAKLLLYAVLWLFLKSILNC